MRSINWTLIGAFALTLASCSKETCPLNPKPRVFLQGGQWKFVGSVDVSRTSWVMNIYDFDNPETQHGYQQLAFFKDGRYIGGYDMGANEKCKIEGLSVVCWGDFPERDRILIQGDGPPRKAIFGGYEVDLCAYEN